VPTLAIGDQQNAILLIQQSQTDPQKAVAELVENSIDAHARNIKLTRTKRGSQLSLVVLDDGDGVPAG
jgi:DNA mismatch repair ATPase MutL